MKKFPPLKIWIGVLILYIIIQSAVIFYYNNTPISKFDLQIAEIKRKKALNPNANHVIYIGSSLVGHGVDTITSNNIVLHKIWDTREPLKEFIKHNHLVKILLEIQPNTVLVQEELPFIRFKTLGEQKNNNIKCDYLSLFFKRIGTINKIVNKYILLNTTLQDYIYPYNLDNKKYISHTQINERDVINHQAFISDAFTSLTSSGIKVIITEIPKPFKNEKVIKTEKYTNDIVQLIKQYNTTSNTNYWSYTGKKMDFIDFIDEGHMAKSGRVYYTQWIIDKLKAELLN